MAGCHSWNGEVAQAVRVPVHLGALGRSKWYEYAVRFAFGGAVTVVAGLVAKRYGPEIGGLFLAFPATATLLEKHEKQKEPSHLRAREGAGIGGRGFHGKHRTHDFRHRDLEGFATLFLRRRPCHCLSGVAVGGSRNLVDA